MSKQIAEIIEVDGPIEDIVKYKMALLKCRNAIEGYKMTNGLHRDSVLNKALQVAKEVLGET